MTNHSTNIWSEALQDQTRQVIDAMPVTVDGLLHLKHPTQGFAHLDIDDLCQGNLVFHTKHDGGNLVFDDVEALLNAGWAMD